jgi:short subunit dehydrogenase-like uncharacterized protein
MLPGLFPSFAVNPYVGNGAPASLHNASSASRHAPNLSLGANLSRGTAKTMIEAISVGTRMRRKGRIVSRDRAAVGTCDFGEGERPTVQVSWGDVATAFHSTGIPSIEVYFEASPAVRALARTPWFVKSFLGLGSMQSLLKSQVDRLPEGPSEADRRAGQAVLIGEARNDRGQTVRHGCGRRKATR